MNKALKKRVRSNIERWLNIITHDYSRTFSVSSLSSNSCLKKEYKSLIVKNKKTPDNFSIEVLQYLVEYLMEINNDIYINNYIFAFDNDDSKYTVYDSHFLFEGIHYKAVIVKSDKPNFKNEYYIRSCNNDKEIDTIHTFNFLYDNYKKK